MKSGSCILGGGTSFLESSATSSSPFFGDRVTFTWQNNFALSTLNNYIFKIEVMDYQGNGPALAFSKEFITDYYEGTLAINRSNLSDISGYNPASFQWRLVMKGYNKTTGNLECETYTVWHIQSF